MLLAINIDVSNPQLKVVLPEKEAMSRCGLLSYDHCILSFSMWNVEVFS